MWCPISKATGSNKERPLVNRRRARRLITAFILLVTVGVLLTMIMDETEDAPPGGGARNSLSAGEEGQSINIASSKFRMLRRGLYLNFPSGAGAGAGADADADASGGNSHFERGRANEPNDVEHENHRPRGGDWTGDLTTRGEGHHPLNDAFRRRHRRVGGGNCTADETRCNSPHGVCTESGTCACAASWAGRYCRDPAGEKPGARRRTGTTTSEANVAATKATGGGLSGVGGRDDIGRAEGVGGEGGESEPPLTPTVQTRAEGATRAECALDAQCGAHGLCTDGGVCKCAVLWTGPGCRTSRPLTGPHLRHPNLSFEGSVVMSRASTKHRQYITIRLPGKENEPSKGFRNLGDVNENLLSLLPETDDGFGAGCSNKGGGGRGGCGGGGGGAATAPAGVDDPSAHRASRSAVYGSCAVVGSSGIMLHHELGAEIDSHDVVIRFNSAPIKGFEKHVGSKTTHRLTNTQNWAFRENTREQLLVHMRSRSHLEGFVATRKGDPSIRMSGFDRDFVEHLANALDFMPTSGFYGVMMALLRCAEVDIYGFHVSAAHGALYHYYDPCDTPANVERDGAEWQVVKLLAEEGVLRIAEPCVAECHEGVTVCRACLSRRRDEVPGAMMMKNASFGGERGPALAGGAPGLGILPQLDLTKFRATSLTSRRGHLVRDATKQNYDQRKKTCPYCAKTASGCRPPSHWSMERVPYDRHLPGKPALKAAP